MRHFRLGGKGIFLLHSMAKHSVGVPWSVCTIKVAFVVHTLCALRVMLDQCLTRPRRPTAPGSPPGRVVASEGARIGLPWPSPKLSRGKPSHVQWHSVS